MDKRIAIGFWLLAFGFLPAGAQRILSLDSCRQMALHNNKQLGISRLKQDVAANIRKSARTKYLPHVSAIGTYQYTSEEISLLSDVQKHTLPYLGTGVMTGLSYRVWRARSHSWVTLSFNWESLCRMSSR